MNELRDFYYTWLYPLTDWVVILASMATCLASATVLAYLQTRQPGQIRPDRAA